MTRIAVGLEYDGSGYAGWQSQRGSPSVQAAVEAALARVAAAPVALIGSGRTDAGVHAIGQVAHFDSEAARPMRGWVLGANTHLPPELSVQWAHAVPDHFHARYSAEWRTYRYLILNRTVRSALAAGRATLIHRPLDHERMQAAACHLTGEHDFSAFRSSECQSKSPVRRLRELTVVRSGDWVRIDATANAFLHHMVRNLAGLLIAVGQGEGPPERARELLACRDRRRGAATAPAEGLYLLTVHYPAAFALPGPAAGDPVGQSAMIAPSR